MKPNLSFVLFSAILVICALGDPDAAPIKPAVVFKNAADMNALKADVGDRVRIEIEVEIERDVPLVKILGANYVRHAHIYGITSGDLKKGQRYFIEGIIVDEQCYGAFPIFMNGHYDPKENPKGNEKSGQVVADQAATAPQLKPAGKEKPMPESEVRPR